MLRAFNDKIIVFPPKTGGKSEGGIIIPDNASGQAVEKGVVYSVGDGLVAPDGTKASDMLVQDDIVYYPAMNYQPLKIGPLELRIISYNAVLAVETVEEDAPKSSSNKIPESIPFPSTENENRTEETVSETASETVLEPELSMEEAMALMPKSSAVGKDSPREAGSFHSDKWQTSKQLPT